MKIIILGSGNIRSNFSYRVLKLATFLRKSGHDVSIIVPSADKYNNFIKEKVASIDGVTIHQPFQFNTKRLEINLIPYIVGAIYRVLKEKSDLVYIYKPTPISIVGLFAKLFGRTKKIILDMDDIGSFVMKVEGQPWYRRVLVAWSEHVAAYYADYIVAASTHLYDFYKKKFPKKRIHVMPNGVDPQWFSSPLIKPTENRKIVFLGSINRTSILDPLFEVTPHIIKKYPNLKILIIGDGQYLSYFKEKASSLGIDNHITFTGWLPLERVQEHLISGDIGYNYMPDEPTIKAASNMKIPQYMARGITPLVSNLGDLPLAVDFGSAGYIAEASNISAFENVLIGALGDPEAHKKSLHAAEYARQKFSWDVLANNFEKWLEIEKKQPPLKRVYVVTTNVPGDQGGPEIRNNNLITELRKGGDMEVTVFGITGQREVKTLDRHAYILKKKRGNWITTLRGLILERVQPSMVEYRLTALAKKFRSICEEQLPDVVQIEQLTAYYCIKPHIPWLKSKGVTVILDAHNVESRLFKDILSLFKPFKKMIGMYLLPHLKEIEIEAAQVVDAVFVCSEYDAVFFRAYNKNVHIIPNTIATEGILFERKKDSHNLLFIGSPAYPPNADGLLFYIKDIHPLIKNEVPDIQTTLIGVSNEWLIEHNVGGIESIEACGHVESITPYLQKAAIGICPIRHGSGTRLKILTCLAAGLPVVTTPKGAEGIDYDEQSGILIADSAEKFAQQIIDICHKNMEYSNASRQARAFVEGQYSNEVMGKALRAIYQQYGK